MAEKNTATTVNENLLNIPKEMEEELVKAIKNLIEYKKDYWKHIFQVLMVKVNEEADIQTLWYVMFLSRLKTEVRLDMPAPAGVYFDFNLNPEDKIKREGYTLVINPIYFSLFDKEEQLAILKHEVQHIFKMHFERFDPEKVNHTIANIAEDLEINGFFDNPNIRNLPGSKDKPDSLYSGCFIDSVLDEYVEKGILKGYDKSKVREAEYYYNLIMQNPELKKEILLKYEERRKQQGQGGLSKKVKDMIKERVREINENFKKTMDKYDKSNNQLSKEELKQKIEEAKKTLEDLQKLNNSSEQNPNNSQCQGQQQSQQQGQQGQQQDQQQGQQGQQQDQQQGQQGQQQDQQSQQQGQQQDQQQGKQGQQQGQQNQSKEGSDNNKIGYDLEKIKEEMKNNKTEKGKTEVVKNKTNNKNKNEENLSQGLDDLKRELNDLITKIAKEVLKAIRDGKFKNQILDDHELEENPEGMSKEEANRRKAKELERQIKNVQDIFDQVVNERNRGYMPSEVNNVLKNIKKIVKPQVDLRKELKKALTDGITKAQEYIRTRQRPHLLYPKDPNYKGKIPDKLPQIVVVLDVSGSMSDLDILAGINEIRNLAKQLGNIPIKLVQVDTEVHSVDEVTFNMTSFNRKGSGGTFLEPAFQFIFDPEGPIKYANVIVAITDGYIESKFEDFKLKDHPELKKVIWLTTKKELHFDINSKSEYKNKMKHIYLDRNAFARAYKAAQQKRNKSSSSPSIS